MSRSMDDSAFLLKARSIMINRRRLVQGGAATAGAIIIGGHQASAAQRRALALAPARQDVKPGGKLRLATSTDPVGLDPMI